MEALIWMASGLVAGWLAGLLMKGRDYGVVGNMILGLFGSLVGGWLMDVLGLAAPTDIPRHVIVSLLGAMLVLGVARRLRPVRRQTRGVLKELSFITDLEASMRKLGEFERRAVDLILQRSKARDPNVAFEEQMTFGQRVADRVAAFGGSWTFIGIFLLTMLVWMIINSQLHRPFDPFPFILLNLVLSCLAALQAPIIMMSQNRQAAKDRLMATTDYEVNLRAEIEIARLNARFERLHEQDWAELVEIQKRQIALLAQLVAQRGGAAGPA